MFVKKTVFAQCIPMDLKNILAPRPHPHPCPAGTHLDRSWKSHKYVAILDIGIIDITEVFLYCETQNNCNHFEII